MGEVTEHTSDSPAVAAQAAVTPMALLDKAVASGATVETLEGLLRLQERYEANEARKAFVRAMAAFKANPPTIVKSKNVSYGNTSYSHANLADVAAVIGKAMSQHGLSFRWETSQQDQVIRVACIVSHEMGHSESISLEASPDSSGQKNSIQAVGSTVTYLERYTLLAITGLAAEDQDDDGIAAAGPVTTEQAETLKGLVKDSGFDVAKLLKWASTRAGTTVASVDELPSMLYGPTEAFLRSKVKADAADA